MKELDCKNIGPKSGHIRDRVFMVTHDSGEFITARTYPKMVTINPTIVGSLMTLSAPQIKNIEIDISQLYSIKNTFHVKVWGDNAECVDCGDDAAKWFSKFILGKDEGLRLVFYPNDEPKPVIGDKKYLFEQADQKDTGTFHDETSYMLMNQGSFDDLNTKIDKPVGALQYRPNFLVKGSAPWAEDSWKWIKIGNHTVFKNIQPCIRCVLTNVDPVKGEKNVLMEPLKTLKTFRSFEKIATNGPVFGIHLGIRQQGKVKLGDEVFVSE